MGKNIILCSDGTGNTSIKGRGTNVFKLYEAINPDPGLNQKLFYDDGVGTERIKILKLLGGAFGLGLGKNVRQLYASLARVYVPGDNIYLFGFSRGAFTVRTLAGFIHYCGILDPEQAGCKDDAALMKMVQGAYKAYRHRYQTLVTKVWRALFKGHTRKTYGFTEIAEFKRQYAHPHENDVTPIHFIGVWDTVSAVGSPVIWMKEIMNWFYQVSFPDHELGTGVAHAYQALSIDDKRKTFLPEMWDEESEGDGDDKRIHQVWFAGVHSNVGGGYPKQGMSLVALDWMMEQAEKWGLSFIPSVRKGVQEHKNVNDKLYDSRSGLAVYYRYAPRDIGQLCNDYNIKVPLIHESVLRRSLDVTDGYAPGNLPRDCRFVATGQPGYVNESEQKLFEQEMGAEHCLLERVRGVIKLRMWLHALFVILSVILAVAMVKMYSFSGLAQMISDHAYLKLAKSIAIMLLEYPYWLLIPVLVVITSSIVARRKIQNTFSRFWYHLRRSL